MLLKFLFDHYLKSYSTNNISFKPIDRIDQKMIKLIAEVGREAGMQTIAEYVGSAETLVLLSELGVDLAQGYFVGRPTKTPKNRSTPISLSSHRQRRSRK